jgi:hypothetical protein
MSRRHRKSARIVFSDSRPDSAPPTGRRFVFRSQTGRCPLITLNDEEIRLLRELESRAGETTVSGNKRKANLEQLVEAKLVTPQLTLIYTITDEGLAWLAQHKPA